MNGLIFRLEFAHPSVCDVEVPLVFSVLLYFGESRGCSDVKEMI